MSSANRKERGFYYDGVYGYIPLRPTFRAALNLKSMQRLRRLKQLATLDLFFPGATHTRFAHSVGVFHLTTAIIDNLMDIRYRNGVDVHPDWPTIEVPHKVAAQLAALFHDVGHGPFSHVFEMFCKRYGGYRDFEHEKISEKLISVGIGEFTDIPLFLGQLRDTFKDRGVPGNLDFLKAGNIARMSQGAPPPADPKYLFLSQIIGCPFGADRMDYLRRDAYYLGVEIGQVDIWEIINNTTLGAETPIKNGRVYALRIDKHAASSVEAFMSARDMTYRRVYYCEGHRGQQELIIRALKDIMSSQRPEDLVMKTDDEMIELFSKDGPLAKNVSERLKQRSLYDALPIKINVSEDLSDAAREAWAELRTTGRDDVFASEDRLTSRFGLKAGEKIILDIEQVPLTKRDDYYGDWLIDPQTNKSMSLIDTLPHLRLTRGTMVDVRTSQPVDLGIIYLNMLSDIGVFAPPELCDAIVDVVKRTAEQEKSNDIEGLVRQEAEKTTCPLAIIFEELTGILRLSGKPKAKLWDKCLDSICLHVQELLQQGQ